MEWKRREALEFIAVIIIFFICIAICWVNSFHAVAR